MSATRTCADAAERGIVIVGAGLAGYGVARELRKRDPQARVTLVTRDDGDFYAKPSLSNALAARKSADSLVTTPAAAMREQLGIGLLVRTTVERIDRQAREIVTTSGNVAYAQLVLATGADPIRLPLAGDAADRVLQVNDLDDYRRFREAISGASRVAILGAGLIGSEFANDLVAAGMRVSVVDPGPRPLAALLPEPAGRWFASRLAANGIDWRFGDSVESVDRAGSALALSLRSGERLEADAVLSAVGLRPRTALASQAGLHTQRGIVVDGAGATSDPAIYALGDCAQYGSRSLPYVQPIMTASRAIGSTIAGTPTPLHFGAMPVVVKTPACPTVILPPDAPDCEWRSEPGAESLEMRCVDAEGRLRGFALLGTAAARRSALLREMEGTARA